MVIDGHSLAFRAFYALPVDSFVNREGQHTNAIHGFISMFINLLRNESPSHVAVAFDISRASFRTREYAEYKGTRAETPPEFKGQIPLLQEALRALGVATITKEDFEADDILATLAREGKEAGYRVLVVSGDRDTIQLVNGDVTLLYPSKQGVSELTRYDPERVHERYGVRPEQYPEIAALVGETSDNLPGVPKVGEKTAVKWIDRFGSLDEILAHRDEITGKVGESLREHVANVERNRKLNRLVDDVDLPVGPADLEKRPIDTDAVREVFGRLEFRTLLDRVMKIAEAEGADIQASAPAAAQRPATQELLDEELEAFLDRNRKSPIALQVQIADGLPVGFGLATETEITQLGWVAGSSDYAPLVAWLASDAPKAMHGAKTQIKAMARAGLAFDGLVFDTELAAWLEAPAAKRGLADLVSRYLGEELPKPATDQLVPDEGALDLAGEAWFLARLAAVMRNEVGESTIRVLDEIELPVLPVLAAMELSGIAVDRSRLDELSADLGGAAAKERESALAAIGGDEVNLGSPKQLQEVLFEKLELPKTRKTKTGYSTDASALADLQASLPEPHPFIESLLAYRDATKLKQTVEGLDRSIADDGRVHTTYVQTGAATGRLSSTDPNLQNIPVRTEAGRRIREAFVVGEGFETLLTADYSQIEMRIMAHLSEDAGLIEAFNEGEDLHSFVGSRIFGVAVEDVTPEMRSKVKAMSYGLAYGLSAFGLSKQLRIDTAEARQLMSDYFARFGGVRDYLRSVVATAKDAGYTETMFGRRRPFPELKSANRVLRENAERAALNSPIQGTAADIIKRAMIAIADEMTKNDMRSRMLLQVHDELLFEVADGERDALEKLVRQRMGNAAELAVPLEVHVGIGTNWNSAAH